MPAFGIAFAFNTGKFLQTTSKGIDPMNVLVAEDDIALASTIVQRVQRWGYLVDQSTTGEETLDKISKNIFDVVLLDIFLGL